MSCVHAATSIPPKKVDPFNLKEPRFLAKTKTGLEKIGQVRLGQVRLGWIELGWVGFTKYVNIYVVCTREHN